MKHKYTKCAIEDVQIRSLTVHSDARGWLSEILTTEQVESSRFGQIHVTTSQPNATRGNHYHTRKTEWFCVIKGKGRLVLEHIDNKVREEITLSGEKLMTVKIPARVAHGIKNTGENIMYLLAYIDEPFNPDNPDTFSYVVVE